MSKQKLQEKEIEENDLVSYLEEKIGHLKPYWSQITLAACAVIVALFLGIFIIQQNSSLEAQKWQLLSIAQDNYNRTLDNSSLSEFADQYPDDQAGLWALLYAADAETRAGLQDFLTDRQAGFDKLEKAEKFYRSVIDSTTEKSTMLQRRSVFGLAYALESAGKFDEATELYQQLVDEENPFSEEASRALKRTTNPAFAALFQEFRDFEEAEAPSEQLPTRPDITFPDAVEQPDSGGGDFETAAADNTESNDVSGENDASEVPDDDSDSSAADSESDQDDQ